MRTKNRFFVFCFIILSCFFDHSFSFGQGSWAQKANYGGGVVDLAIGFSIGNKGYIGTGEQASAANVKSDLWEYAPASNTWTQMASLPGTPRCYSVAFSIGTKGYVGTGLDGSTIMLNDFWEWDQPSNTWTQKTNFPGVARYGAAGFSIGNKGYIGTGNDAGYVAQSDFWEYDPASNAWTQKANYGGGARIESEGFSIGNKGYLGIGVNSSYAAQSDFWEYNPALNTWTQKANFGGGPRAECFGFSILCKGYIGTGSDATNAFRNDFWEYDTTSNTWTQLANYGGGTRYANVGFSIGNLGYVGTGYNGPQWADFWEYTPGPNSCAALTANVSSRNVLCFNQCTGTGTVTPTGGTGPYSYSWSNGQTTRTATGLCAGIYTVTVTDVSANTKTATITITQPAVLASTVTSATASCLGQCNGNASVNATGGTPGYSYSWNSSPVQSGVNASGLCPGSYTCTVTDINGCFDTVHVVINSLPVPIPAIAGTDTICRGTPVLLNASGGSVYSWSTGASVQNITISPSSTSAYTVTVSDANGCTADTAFTITVLPSPLAAIASNVTITTGQSTTLTATGGIAYLWNNGETNSVITVGPLTTTQYCVIVMDLNGCADTTCVTVTVEPIDCFAVGQLYLPNSFSPNNDGENDFLQIYYGNIQCIKTFTLTVFNRWGEKVYEATDPSGQWDGSYKNMIQCTSVYMYYLDATLINGVTIVKRGNVSLLR